jgi:hypothetical protein
MNLPSLPKLPTSFNLSNQKLNNISNQTYYKETLPPPPPFFLFYHRKLGYLGTMKTKTNVIICYITARLI